MRYPIVARDFD